MKLFNRRFIWSIFYLGWLASGASAANTLVVFSGAEIDNHSQGYDYLGADLTHPLNERWAIAGRVMGNYLTYQYFAGTPRVRADAPGVNAEIGVKWFYQKTIAGLFAGPDFRDTTFNPDQPTQSYRGADVNGVVQGEIEHTWASQTNASAFANFSGISDFVYERFRLKQQVNNHTYAKPLNINVGIEQIYGRNVQFSEAGGGGVLEFYYIPSNIDFALRCGYKHDTTFGAGIYGGVELSKRIF